MFHKVNPDVLPKCDLKFVEQDLPLTTIEARCVLTQSGMAAL